ncbi:hypothetical protein [Primorskyibacter sp. S187A]|uniref:hypothetical protein n=1 Tax=Primorskyibacter sp. S187A TaxID=3415130 RepID=UPI003C7D920A
MPKLIKLYITQCLLGFVISAIFTAILLYYNVANLGHLVTSDPMGWLAVLMIWYFNGTVFAAVQFAIKVMALREDEPQKPGGGTRILAYARATENDRV